MTGGVALALVVLVGLVAPLVLYWLVRAERDASETMDRERAERVARQDVDDRNR